MEQQLLQSCISHKIKSSTYSGKRVLLILDYDYFLNKRDLSILLKSYRELILVKDDMLSNTFLRNYIHDHVDIVCYNNFDYLSNTNSNLLGCSMNIFNPYTFCERFLKKCYVPHFDNGNTSAFDNLHYFSLSARLLKKSVDLFVGLLILVVSLPVCLFSCLVIYIQSKGKVIFVQKRVGIRGNEFMIYKFRSMHLNAEATGAQFATKNDNRTFPFGRTIRQLRIDEIPQIINILKGELSLIGPRPERKIFTDKFSSEIPYYSRRHTVKPGISGYAQVMYPYGSGAVDARHKLMYDLYYVKNWTFRLEIQILLKTLWTVISRKGV